MRGDIGQIEIAQHLNRRRAVIIGGATNEAKARQRHHRIHAVIREILRNCRTAIQPTRKGGNHGQTCGLHLTDHAIIMGGVRRQNVRAHHQQADCRNRIFRLGQISKIGGDAIMRQVRVIEPKFWVINRRFSLCAMEIRLAGIATHQEADHLLDIIIRATQPILHRQKPCAQILRLAGNKAQNFRQSAQHSHLLMPRIRVWFG